MPRQVRAGDVGSAEVIDAPISAQVADVLDAGVRVRNVREDVSCGSITNGYGEVLLQEVLSRNESWRSCFCEETEDAVQLRVVRCFDGVEALAEGTG